MQLNGNYELLTYPAADALSSSGLVPTRATGVSISNMVVIFSTLPEPTGLRQGQEKSRYFTFIGKFQGYLSGNNIILLATKPGTVAGGVEKFGALYFHQAAANTEKTSE
jgi:hypothetical protein